MKKRTVQGRLKLLTAILVAGASVAAAQDAEPPVESHAATAAQVGATVVAKVPRVQAIVLVPKKPSLEQLKVQSDPLATSVSEQLEV